ATAAYRLEIGHKDQARQSALDHQNGGASLTMLAAVAVAGRSETRLHYQRMNVRVERLQCPRQRTAHFLDRLAAALDHLAALGIVVEQIIHRPCQNPLVTHKARATMRRQFLIGIAEVLHVATRQNRCIEHCRLKWILAALASQRTPDKSNLRQAQIEPHLANRIAKIYVRLRGDRISETAACD